VKLKVSCFCILLETPVLCSGNKIDYKQRRSLIQNIEKMIQEDRAAKLVAEKAKAEEIAKVIFGLSFIW
jgi:hypothetical protein